METSDFFLFLLGTLTVMLGYFLTNIADDLRELEKNIHRCQSELPVIYVRKEDYKHDIDEIKKTLGKIYDRLEAKEHFRRVYDNLGSDEPK